MVLTKEKLEEIGLALYGAHWQAVLAKRLRRARRTIIRWRKGAPMPVGMREALAALVDDQLVALGKHSDDLHEPIQDFG